MIPQPPHPEHDAPADPDSGFHGEILHGVIAVASDLTLLVQRQAHAQAEATPLAPLTHAVNAVDKLARTIRKTILLARKVAEPLPNPAAHRAAARRQIIRTVEDTIQRHVAGEEADALRAELMERLDAPDVEDDIISRPAADIITEICRDLGLVHVPGHHPWACRTPAEVAALCARAATPRRASPKPGCPPATSDP